MAEQNIWYIKIEFVEQNVFLEGLFSTVSKNKLLKGLIESERIFSNYKLSISCIRDYEIAEVKSSIMYSVEFVYEHYGKVEKFLENCYVFSYDKGQNNTILEELGFKSEK